MNVYIGGPVVISEMQGPCEEGFHIALDTERSGLKTIMDSLSFTESYGEPYRIYLKMPYAGMILGTSGGKSDSGRAAFYWSSSINSGSPWYAYGEYIASYSLSFNGNDNPANGFSIRPFKNIFVVPSSNWTVLKGTLGSAGIFWNQTEGIISITGDGTTGYTIADKNLGATVVYNDGDTLSASNCGNYYQFGNNYGFPYSGPTTFAYSKVNAGSYGPGNYYESSTFILYDSGWDSSYNTNLRGGTSQGTSTKSVEVKNIYIGEYGWKPGADTTMYFKFNGNLKDEISGTTYTASGITFGDLSNGNKYAAFPGNSNGRFSVSNNLTGGGSEITMLLWFQVSSTSNMRNEFSTSSYYTSAIFDSGNLGAYYYNNSYDIYGGSSWGTQLYTINTWHLYGQTIKASGKIKIFLDGQKVAEKTMQSSLGSNGGSQYIGSSRSGSNTFFSGKMSELIAEKKEWTEQEVSEYYNQTKANYGY